MVNQAVRCKRIKARGSFLKKRTKKLLTDWRRIYWPKVFWFFLSKRTAFFPLIFGGGDRDGDEPRQFVLIVVLHNIFDLFSKKSVKFGRSFCLCGVL